MPEDHLTTESRHTLSETIDVPSAAEIVALMSREDEKMTASGQR